MILEITWWELIILFFTVLIFSFIYQSIKLAVALNYMKKNNKKNKGVE